MPRKQEKNGINLSKYDRVSLTGCGKTRFTRNILLEASMLTPMATKPQDAQKGRPARPQRAKRRGVRFGTLSL
jgi:hypothetical protein